jgi:hypothetical protein
MGVHVGRPRRAEKSSSIRAVLVRRHIHASPTLQTSSLQSPTADSTMSSWRRDFWSRASISDGQATEGSLEATGFAPWRPPDRSRQRGCPVGHAHPGDRCRDSRGSDESGDQRGVLPGQSASHPRRPGRDSLFSDELAWIDAIRCALQRQRRNPTIGSALARPAKLCARGATITASSPASFVSRKQCPTNSSIGRHVGNRP